jgi:23S rRNA (adenine2503-C2)-methyltransferase
MTAPESPRVLLGKTLPELSELLASLGQPAYRAKQLAQWLYVKNAVRFDDMTNLPATLRQQLAAQYSIGRTAPLEKLTASDGTAKYLFPAADGSRFIETAMIPDGDRKTLCLSTQIGCKRACTFCATGRQGFAGNLTDGEILNQYFSCDERDQITNIVYMGMGEPLDNPEAVFRSIEVFTADYATAKSPSRITVSTVGILPAMQEYLDRFSSHLAVSLHTPRHEERLGMMPVEKVYPIADVIALLRRRKLKPQQRLTFECTLLAGTNDTPRHARETARLLNGLDCRVNLIPCNPTDRPEAVPSDRATLEAFQQILKQHGLTTTIRKSKGSDIQAACGMLSTLRCVADDQANQA